MQHYLGQRKKSRPGVNSGGGSSEYPWREWSRVSGDPLTPCLSDALADASRREKRVRAKLRRKGYQLHRQRRGDQTGSEVGYHVTLYDSIVFGFGTAPFAATLRDVERYAEDVRIEVWDLQIWREDD